MNKFNYLITEEEEEEEKQRKENINYNSACVWIFKKILVNRKLIRNGCNHNGYTNVKMELWY